MGKRKKPTQKGKIRLSVMFQALKPGDKVTVKRELAVSGSFPDRIIGRTGIIEEVRGKSYLVKINDLNKEKRFIVKPIHLKKLK